MGSGCQARHVFAALRRLEGIGELEVLVDLGVRGKGFGCKLNKAGVEVFWRNGRDDEVSERTSAASVRSGAKRSEANHDDDHV